jgi:flagellar hook-basal body complex protein FliE
MMTTDQLIPIFIAVLSAGGLWTYLSNKAKHSYESMKDDKSRSAEFQETLKAQVDKLSDKLDQVLADKEQLLREVSELKASLARAEATIHHLEQRLMSK